MDIRELYRYSDNCRRLLYETVKANPQVFDTPFQTLSSHMSVRRLIAHMIGAEQRWIEKYIGGRDIERYENNPPETIDALFADWERQRAKTEALIAALDPAGLSRRIPVNLPHWGFEQELTIEQLLFHIINHETHHRAQVSMALQQMQIDPPNFDFIFLQD